jgi:hypothetical protein
MMFKKKPINYLSMIPIRVIKEFTEENGKVTLLIPKFKHPFFQKFFIPKRKSAHFRIHLDALGSQVWKQIDGKKDVGLICSELSASIPSGQAAGDDQFEYRVTKFLSELYKSRFIRFDKNIIKSE